MTPLSRIPSLFQAYQARWSDRDERMALTDEVVRGNWAAVGPDDEEIENRSPNLVQVALEDTAESASYLPTVRVTPSGPEDTHKEKAAAMERMAMSYLDRSQFDLMAIKTLYDLAGFGFHSWVVNFDNDIGGPIIEWRDPRYCYPEQGWRTLDSTKTCMFARALHVSQLSPKFQKKLQEAFQTVKQPTSGSAFHDRHVTIVELYEEDWITVAALYQSGAQAAPKATALDMTPVLLERTKTVGGICPVIINQRVTLDGEPRGQFDQVIDVLKAHIRLMGLVLDYSDQAVYSDIWVKDLVGQMTYGGGSYIQLGPQGAIGRVPPAVSSLAVQATLDDIVTSIHVGGRWPKSRPGEVSQAIASAKFIEATAGMMNTAIRTYHLIMKRSMEQALRVCFKQDKALGRNRQIAGVLRNQQFVGERKKSDIDLEAQVTIDYGIGLGRDPQTTMVLGIQGMQTKIWSTEFVQEHFDGITDVAREQQRIDVQQLKDMAFAQILQGVQSGQIPQRALVEISKARASGEDIFTLFEKYIVEPAEAIQQQQIPSGITGQMQNPGGAPAPAGAMPPPPPDVAAMLAGMGGAPGGQPQPETIGRLSARIDGGGFAGSQSSA